MNKLLIGYDLRKPGRNYDSLIKAIESYGTYYHVLDSTWIITTNRTFVQVRDHLRQHIDANDALMVVGLNGQAAWYGLSSDGVNWINNQMAA